MNSTIKQRIEAIRRGVVPEGYKKTKWGTAPDQWTVQPFTSCFSRMMERNSVGNTNVLTISAQYGLINQEDFFNKNIASENKQNYFLLKKGDFAYNKSYSSGYPYGAIKPLTAYEAGIVSPLYICFRPTAQNQCPKYFEHYFEGGMHNREIKAIAEEGARNHGLLNIAVPDFFSTLLLVPPFEEQEAIADVLTRQDQVIDLKQRRLDEKRQKKKYLMQTLLSGKRRLPGFSGKWEKVRLKTVLTERKEKKQDRELTICSVAVTKGVVDQIAHLGRSYAAANTSNYNVVKYGDIVYTKSPTGEFPFGIVKQSRILEDVAVSPLYGVFEPVSFELGVLLHCFFEYPINANNYLAPIIQKGAKNTINITNETFLSNYVILPPLEEQAAIAEVLSTADEELSLLERDLEQEKLRKKALMQLLLTGLVRVGEL